MAVLEVFGRKTITIYETSDVGKGRQHTTSSTRRGFYLNSAIDFSVKFPTNSMIQ